MSRPIHIVMTPTRNEAWVIRAFLESTSRWANYIIIADQMSTDGTREIVSEYAARNQTLVDRAKIILINNKNPDFNEAERQSILVATAREIAVGRDTLLWGLDADEILAANAFETEDWRRIINSKPGSVFWFKWAEICPNQKEFWSSPTTYYPWLFHDDGKEPHGNYVRNMHSMRIPYPIEEKQMYYVDDFRVLHLAYLNSFRVASKRRFYQFVDWEMNHRSPIILSRSYAQTKQAEEVKQLTPEMIPADYDVIQLVDTKSTRCYMDKYIVDRLPKHNKKEFRKLDIWDDVFLSDNNLSDPRTFLDKRIHNWLWITRRYHNYLLVRIVDKVLNKIYR